MSWFSLSNNNGNTNRGLYSIFSYFSYVLWLSLPLVTLLLLGARQNLWLDLHNFLEGLCLLNRDLKGS